MRTFCYDPAITERFPTIVGGVTHAVGVTNPTSPDDLVEAFMAEQSAVLARFGATPLSELRSTRRRGRR